MFLLAPDGHLFALGNNAYGQLGLLADSSSSTKTPWKKSDISSLNGEPIRKIATGEQHSFILTQSGRLFACGDNSAFQITSAADWKNHG
jgi:alpha-tubulin suppressor-like RCC1 family protein